MSLILLQRLASKGEGQLVEFKKKANFPEKIVRELVAFANSEGGHLLLGVDDDGTVSGTRDIEGEVFILQEAISKLIKPKLAFSSETFNLNQKKGVAVFKVPEGSRKPYIVKEDESAKFGTAFVRYKDETIKASKEMYQILKRRNREKDQQFNYGEKEQILMQLLQNHETTTLSEFSEAASISKFMASKTLVKLVLANVLDIKPTPQGDLFFLKSPLE